MNQRKVLLISSFQNQWNDAWYYKAGLEQNGHTVLTFDPSTWSDPESIVFQKVKEFKPDIILHTKDELSADIFQELRKFTRIIQWYPDLAIHDWLPSYVRASDVFFTMAEGHVDELKSYNPHVYWLTQAFEPSYFKVGKITPQDKKIFSSDITFVGSLGSKDFYKRRRDLLRWILHRGFDLRWWGPRLPVKFSTLSLLLGKLGRSYGGRFVYGEEHAKIAKLSKIYLGIDAMPHVQKSMSERIYIAVGCGAFYMCQHVSGIEEVFEPGKEIVTFHSEEEMGDMIRYYLSKADIRQSIARSGEMRVLRDHTYKVRMRRMIEIVHDCIQS